MQSYCCRQFFMRKLFKPFNKFQIIGFAGKCPVTVNLNFFGDNFILCIYFFDQSKSLLSQIFHIKVILQHDFIFDKNHRNNLKLIHVFLKMYRTYRNWLFRFRMKTNIKIADVKFGDIIIFQNLFLRFR